MRTIYLQSLTQEKLGLVHEDRGIKEMMIERPEQSSLTGNIYKGKVINIEKSLQAAFVSYAGTETGFLTKKELPQTRSSPQKPIESFLTEGQQIVVQVIKEAYKGKGAVLTANVTFPGIHLVYLPFGGYIAVSKKLEQTKNSKLKAALSALTGEYDGAIIRTSAANVSQSVIEQEFMQLRHNWVELEKRSSHATTTSLLFEDKLIPDRLLRKYAGKGIDSVVCDHAMLSQSIRERIPGLENKVHWNPKWEKELPQGIQQLMEKVINPYVSVSGGAEVVIEQTEAMAVIDVNSGSFVKKTTKNETALQVNLAVVPVIAAEVRLRNLSGIIVIDFISMRSEADQRKVIECLRRELKKDSVRTEVYGFTSLGLLEISRKRELPSVPEILTGEAKSKTPIVSSKSKAYQLERELISRLQHKSEALLVDVNPEVYDVILSLLPASQLIEKKKQTVYSRITGEVSGYSIRMEGTSELVEEYIHSKPAEVIDKLF